MGSAAADPWGLCDRLLAQASGPDDAGAPEDGEEEEDDPMQGGPCEFITGAELAARSGAPLSTGLGAEIDRDLLGGGLWAGEVDEVFGPPGVGKTQLGLSIAAHAASSGCSVMYVTAKDPPIDLASRIHEIIQCLQSQPGLAAERQRDTAAILGAIRFVSTPDFPSFARAVTTYGRGWGAGGDGCGGLPRTAFVFDGLSTLFSQYTAAQSSGYRWRLAWAWRSLRQLAVGSGSPVLLLSHTVGATQASGGGGGPRGGRPAGSQPALGQLWATAASTRLELSAADPGRELRLTVRKSARGPVGPSAPLLLGSSGVHAAAAAVNGGDGGGGP
mmetsp:Transcript_25853/g.73053  ORF Transcript_25853/g.73053 Transcript_25853/m.73053 type:complete len:330 (-) Transcript_25853:120-1109(-)